MDEQVVALWYRYEEIAMHFNNLLMQYRLQLLGGAGAIGTVASYLIGSKVLDEEQHDWLRALVSTGFFILLVAAASLDVFYYNRLLRGSVDALLEFEARHPEIQMSTRIEAAVGAGRHAIWAVYAMILTALGGFSLWAWCRYFGRHRPATSATKGIV